MVKLKIYLINQIYEPIVAIVNAPQYAMLDPENALHMAEQLGYMDQWDIVYYYRWEESILGSRLIGTVETMEKTGIEVANEIMKILDRELTHGKKEVNSC